MAGEPLKTCFLLLLNQEIHIKTAHVICIQPGKPAGVSKGTTLTGDDETARPPNLIGKQLSDMYKQLKCARVL